MRAVAASLAVATLLVIACGGGGEVSISDAWVRAAAEGQNSAVYLRIENDGDADVLLSATADVARMSSLHQTTFEGSVVRMEALSTLEIPAASVIALEPGATHVMLMVLERELVPGETVPVQLYFEHAGVITVDAEVRALGE